LREVNWPLSKKNKPEDLEVRNMERLTYFTSEKESCQVKGADNWTCKEVCENYVRCDACPIDIAMHRLADYEDTGLEPEEIEELKEKGTTQKMHKPNPNVYCCPECGEALDPVWDYCPWCGQHVID